MSNIMRYDLAWKNLIENIKQRKEFCNTLLLDDILLSSERIINYYTYISDNEVKRRYKKYGLTETILRKKRKEKKLHFATRHYGDAFQYLYHEDQIKKLVEEIKNDRNNN